MARVTAYYDSIYKETLGRYTWDTVKDEFMSPLRDYAYEKLIRSK